MLKAWSGACRPLPQRGAVEETADQQHKPVQNAQYGTHIVAKLREGLLKSHFTIPTRLQATRSSANLKQAPVLLADCCRLY
jgi:hypothetical protein